MEPKLAQVEDAPESRQSVEPVAMVPPAEDGLVKDPPPESVSRKNQDPWKTAFIVLIGVVLLSGVLIYSTSSRRTDPATVLQTDANGQPVQPLSPAAGVEEERLAAMPADAVTSNSNLSVVPGQQIPGGDGYNPWANGGTPPAGAPKVGPGGGYVTVPGGGSQFMPPECIMQPSGIYLCPVPTNTNAAVKPTPVPRNSANANVQASPTPATPKATPTPAVKPSPTPRARSTPLPAKTPGLEN